MVTAGATPSRRRCFDRLAFKKTCPFEFTRHGRPWAGTETRLALLPSEVSQGEYQKGKIRFSGERLKPKPIGQLTHRERSEPKPVELKPFTLCASNSTQQATYAKTQEESFRCPRAETRPVN